MTRKSKKQQAQDAELRLIADAMGQAMLDANRNYIVGWPNCYEYGVRFTPNMRRVWNDFVEFCRRSADEK